MYGLTSVTVLARVHLPGRPVFGGDGFASCVFLVRVGIVFLKAYRSSICSTACSG